MQTFNVHQAKTHLSRLLRRVAGGEEIVIVRNGEPIAKMVPFTGPRRSPGRLAGKIEIEHHFDSPLPSGIAGLLRQGVIAAGPSRYTCHSLVARGARSAIRARLERRRRPGLRRSRERGVAVEISINEALGRLRVRGIDLLEEIQVDGFSSFPSAGNTPWTPADSRLTTTIHSIVCWSPRREPKIWSW